MYDLSGNGLDEAALSGTCAWTWCTRTAAPPPARPRLNSQRAHRPARPLPCCVVSRPDIRPPSPKSVNGRPPHEWAAAAACGVTLRANLLISRRGTPYNEAAARGQAGLG